MMCKSICLKKWHCLNRSCYSLFKFWFKRFGLFVFPCKKWGQRFFIVHQWRVMPCHGKCGGSSALKVCFTNIILLLVALGVMKSKLNGGIGWYQYWYGLILQRGFEFSAVRYHQFWFETIPILSRGKFRNQYQYQYQWSEKFNTNTNTDTTSSKNSIPIPIPIL